MSNNSELVKHIIQDIEDDLSDEEIIHLLLSEKVSSKNPKKIEVYTFGQKAADKLAAFAGSWTFIITFAACLFAWILINLYFLINPFDPYPFILLNLVLSCIAATQAPLIMMSQNRQEIKDRIRSENDYKVNLKTEIVIQDLHAKMDLLLENQVKIMEKLEMENVSEE